MLSRGGLRRAAVVLACGMVLAGCRHAGTPAAGSPPASRTPASASPSPSPSPSLAPVSYPLQGTGRYRLATGTGAVVGHAGTLMRYRVAEERGIWHLPVADFAAAVDRVLGDPRDWTAGGDWRFQRVGPGAPHDFTVYLVTPVTRDRLCGATFDRYTSCRNGDSVVINISRWMHGVPYYHNLTEYREYAISHEVGHRLGHGHELCPGKGRPAPTMQQQTLGLHGCTPNPWPYLHGKRYAGPLGEYPLIVPTDPPSYYRSG